MSRNRYRTSRVHSRQGAAGPQETTTMSCRFAVRTREGVWQGDVDDWTGLVILAALSAGPESFAELADAVRRYQPEHRLFEQPRKGWDDAAANADGAWCLVDLTGRTVVASGFELP